MAYVAISKGLIEDVNRVLYRLKAAELETIKEKDLDGISEESRTKLTGLVEDALWGELIDLKPRLDKFSKVINPNIRYKKDVEGLPMPESIGTSLHLRLRAPIFNADESRYAYTIDRALLEQIPEFAEWEAAIDARREIVKRWDEGVRKQVIGFLTSAKSLNEALKLWPDVRRFIPKEYLEKAEAKTEKAAKKESAALETLKNIDIGAINASTVLARMAGAQI